ncbi:sucrose nonfermenting 4-like protein [Gastrolobium bilobum]|uniref:sucrose nonfermenting 4-like protein n=1 Tax=Gastrolobium bilobum TaxID=150636 RepID=UPI002AB2DC04|nr:sucrose nonfermenting 4-like protein [Gastrolobium bilobum]
MFGSVASRRQGSSGVAESILIPKQFIWPYGGRRVFLCGSFTRWAVSIPMSPMEGCPTVFQVICRLMPGYHQYKFNVDGEWRHDEQQPFVFGNYGLVNTIYLVREPSILPAILRVEAPGRSHMEVDNDVVRHVVPTLTLELFQEADPRMSESDLQVSRYGISTFLSTHTAYELLPQSSKVIALDINLPVKEAFHVFYEQGVSLAPLWDSCKCQFVGVLSASDFILILKELGNHGSNLTEEQLATHTIAAWKEGKLQQCATDSSGSTYPQRFVHAGPHECLKDVALKILQNKMATVPIIHYSSEDGSFPQLLHLATLSGILKCICRHFEHSCGSLPILQLPIISIPLGTWAPKVGQSNKKPLAMLRPNASLGAALSLLIQAEVSSIPIVDDNDSLLDIYSRSDIIALVKDKAYAGISLDKFSIHQALLLGRGANSPYGLHNGQRCHMCLASDSLHKVMERLANPGVRRLVIVEAGSRRVQGIISLGDVFRFLLG